VVKGFKMQYGKADESAGVFGIMHGDWFVLVDAEGRIRGYYDSSDTGQLDKLMLDAERLVNDPKS
jgi:protein SCO1/2